MDQGQGAKTAGNLHHIIYYQTRADQLLTVSACVYVQEQSSRRVIGDLEGQLQFSEALVAEFQKTLQQRDAELERLRSKVGPPSPESLHPNSQCRNTASCTPVTVSPQARLAGWPGHGPPKNVHPILLYPLTSREVSFRDEHVDTRCARQVRTRIL